MKKSLSANNMLGFWQEKLKEYQKKYDQLKKQSPDRWWHDEFFENQMRVLEGSIISAKKRIEEIKEGVKNK